MRCPPHTTSPSQISQCSVFAAHHPVYSILVTACLPAKQNKTPAQPLLKVEPVGALSTRQRDQSRNTEPMHALIITGPTHLHMLHTIAHVATSSSAVSTGTPVHHHSCPPAQLPHGVQVPPGTTGPNDPQVHCSPDIWYIYTLPATCIQGRQDCTHDAVHPAPSYHATQQLWSMLLKMRLLAPSDASSREPNHLKVPRTQSHAS